MIRRILIVLALTIGIAAPTLAIAEPASAGGAVRSLVNGGCKVTVGFTLYGAWVQVMSTGCAYVEIQATDYGCYYWTSARWVLNNKGIPYGWYMQTANLPKASHFVYVYTRSTQGYIRDGTVSYQGAVNGW